MGFFGLFRKSNRPDLPVPSFHILGDYNANFMQAIKFSRHYDLSMANFNWRWNKQPVDEGDLSKIIPALEAAGVPGFEYSAFQCMKWCHFMAPIISQALGRNVSVTIGQIWKKDHPVFDPSWNDLTEWIKGGGIDLTEYARLGKAGINIHAWLTIDSGQIIEATFHHSLVMAYPDHYDELKGRLLCTYPAYILRDHNYFPMAVGQSFVEALAGGKGSPLLANSAEDLYAPSLIIAAK
ncbi:hypothetical protein [Corticibacter populi]|uniref:hypothetical protein n=1 Tax=Corticibacter populi TaxID=1550736 RepID=UPI00102BD57E|nr:hypothetical protein [Corticibacter populi]RZS35518.1 hypothetical protein EV687_0588 [Corticibacter populi]